MAERRSVRTTRRPRDDELAADTREELAEEPEAELGGEEPEDEFAEEEPEDELADEESGPARGGGDGGARRRSRAGRDGLTAARAGQSALRQIAELTGKEPEGVTGVEPADDGWLVGVEVVEDRRIPSSTDILATYETEIDSSGNLVSYRRVRRYTRGRGDDGDI
jgi:hypothetical protein